MTGYRRLIVVSRADPEGGYAWLPPRRPGDVTVVLDEMARAELPERDPIAFDSLWSWEQRSAAEHRVSRLLAAIGRHPALTAPVCRGFRLIDFAEYRLRTDVERLLRGWALARFAAGAEELVCDPALAPALLIGARAGLGLPWQNVRYALSPALAGSRPRRALARQGMRAFALASRPGGVRVAAVCAGKLALALAALPAADLRSAGVGLMPFPGLDHGNGLMLAVRRRLALLRTYGPRRRGGTATMILPDRLGLVEDAELDRALSHLLGHVLACAAPELDQAVGALRGMAAASNLRAVLLPSAAYGASRLLIEWAHQRGLRVGVMQHGIYSFREFDGGDRHADVLLGWGAGTAEQIACWPQPRPRLLPIGVPGLPARDPRSRGAGRAGVVRAGVVRRVLIATSSTVETPLVPSAFCEAFVDTLAPGIERLVQAGVEVQLRPHPGEDPERYRRLLRARGLAVQIALEVPFAQAAATVDLLVSSASSVAFEAAALGLPVLLWMGGAPRWVREEHLVAPWTSSPPGTFVDAEGFAGLAEGLVAHPAAALRLGGELGRLLERYAEPFDATRFAAAVCALAA